MFAVFSVGLAAVMMVVSLWRQGQETLFPHTTYFAPTPAPALPLEITHYSATYHPRIQPLTPLFLPKMVWQRLALMVPQSKDTKQTRLLKRAEERMFMALSLWQRGAPQNAQANLLKSQQYLLKAAQVDTRVAHEQLRQLQQQHGHILTSLQASETNSLVLSEALSLNEVARSLLMP